MTKGTDGGQSSSGRRERSQPTSGAHRMLDEITRVSWGSRYLGAFDRFGERPPFAPFVPSDG
ncbi:hypothetical protein ABIC85_001280 [Oerskovia enterophila]